MQVNSRFAVQWNLRESWSVNKETRDKYTLKYLPLVKSIASKLQHRGVDFDDLVQTGTIGLIQAIDKNNAVIDEGVFPLNYAKLIIKAEMLREIEKNTTVRIPRNALLLSKQKKDGVQLSAKDNFTAELAQQWFNNKKTPVVFDRFVSRTAEPLQYLYRNELAKQIETAQKEIAPAKLYYSRWKKYKKRLDAVAVILLLCSFVAVKERNPFTILSGRVSIKQIFGVKE